MKFYILVFSLAFSQNLRASNEILCGERISLAIKFMEAENPGCFPTTVWTCNFTPSRADADGLIMDFTHYVWNSYDGERALTHNRFYFAIDRRTHKVEYAQHFGVAVCKE